ncbi:hypothetical protein H0H93_009534 [Arthromyces matolae]|nr:hypothetical protein H0H93_009534 [Arthromyces matolae]
MVLVFVHNAIGTGALSFYAPLDIAICYRKHFLPTALTTSLISIFLEFYVLVRLSSILIKHVTLASQRLTALNDGRIARVLALLLFDLLTIGPSAVHINVLADFIPLSIGALFVLSAVYFRPLRSTLTVHAVTFNNSMPHPDGTHTLNSGVPASSPNPVRRSMWFRSSSGASSQVQPNVSGKSPAPPAVPKSLLHPFSAQYQPEASRFSTTTGSMSIEEGIIQTAQRSAPPTATGTVIAAETASAPVTSSQDGYEILSIDVIPPATSEADAQAMSPEMSPSITPTSILMHPWHEKHDEGSRQYNADGYDRRTSVASTIKPTQHLSYTVQGFTFPKPPIPSPTGATQRYSSSTLASPLFSQEGGESSEGQRRVQLLTFASTFRSASAGVIKDSKANALNPSQPVST